MSNQLKIIYSESWRRELSIGIYMGPIEGEGVGGVVGGGPESFGPPPKKFTGSFLRNFNIIEILSSSPVDWHPF